MICFPNIKINLGLQVINRRTDGFHNIESVFYPVNFCDMLEVVEDPSGQRGDVTFTATGIPVAGEAGDNLVIKAYHLLHAQFDLPSMKIHLHKLIPMGAGLGGGSSNAAYMLKLLNAKCKLGLTTEEMETYAAQLGSDCAFFIRNQASYLFGRGHEIEPYSIHLRDYYIVLLYAGIHSNTSLAYQHVTRREELTAEQSLKTRLQQPMTEWKQTIVNDFEPSVFLQFPLLADLKAQLYDSGALYAGMSGSGSALYGIFTKKPQLGEKLRPLVCYEGLLP